MVTINGSALGCVDGLDQGAGTSGLQYSNYLVKHSGAPNNILTSPVASGLCIDVANNELYLATTATGSTWIHLGSVS
jgi:hypothetical protein